MFRVVLFVLAIAIPAYAVTQDAWHRGLNEAGAGGRVVLSSPYMGGLLIPEIEAKEREQAYVEIRANIASAGVVWSSYPRVCTTKEALWRVHYPYNSSTGELHSIGAFYMMAHVSPTIAQALFDSMTARKPGNPTTDIPGSVLIERGEVPECQ